MGQRLIRRQKVAGPPVRITPRQRVLFLGHCPKHKTKLAKIFFEGETFRWCQECLVSKLTKPK
jgi:hypothetical protein